MHIDNHFNLWDKQSNRFLTAAEAERTLVDVFTDPVRYKQWAPHLGDIDPFWLHLLAIMANPSLRAEVWDATLDDGQPVLSETLKFHLVVHSPENEGAALELVRRVVHDLVSELYVEEVESP